MEGLPRLSIGLVTYKRTDLAVRTIRGVSEFLDYPKELRSWYIGDDGSPDGHTDTLLNTLQECKETTLGYHSQRFSPLTGEGWNRTLGICHQNSDFVLFLEDDWELREKHFDIVPYVKMLIEREDVGMVRLGHLAVGSDVHIIGHAGIHYLQYQKTTPYAYSGNPHIRHARFTRYYGWFAIDKNPGEIELDYDWRFRTMPDGPKIWRPADIPAWGVWHHIGTEKSF